MSHAAVATPLHTAEDLLALGDSFHGELVDGRLVEMSPTSGRHSIIEGNLTFILIQWCRANAPSLRVGTGEMGFILARNPDVVRGADVAVVTREQATAAARGFVEGAPLVAVEILSPSNTATEIEEKLEDYLSAGTKSVWVVDPVTKKVVVWRSLRERDLFTGDATVTDAALPGFEAPLAEIFQE